MRKQPDNRLLPGFVTVRQLCNSGGGAVVSAGGIGHMGRTSTPLGAHPEKG